MGTQEQRELCFPPKSPFSYGNDSKSEERPSGVLLHSWPLDLGIRLEEMEKEGKIYS